MAGTWRIDVGAPLLYVFGKTFQVASTWDGIRVTWDELKTWFPMTMILRHHKTPCPSIVFCTKSLRLSWQVETVLLQCRGSPCTIILCELVGIVNPVHVPSCVAEGSLSLFHVWLLVLITKSLFKTDQSGCLPLRTALWFASDPRCAQPIENVVWLVHHFNVNNIFMSVDESQVRGCIYYSISINQSQG